MADGSILIETKIDTKEAEKGLANLEKAARLSVQGFDKAFSSVDTSTASIGESVVKAADEVKGLGKAASSAGKKINKSFDGVDKSIKIIDKSAVITAESISDIGDSASASAGQINQSFSAADKAFVHVESSTQNAVKQLDKVTTSAKKAASGIQEVGAQTKKLDGEEIQKFVRDLDNVNAQIETQQRLVEELQQKYEHAFSFKGADAPETMKLQMQVLKAEAALNRLTDTSDKTAAKIWELDEASTQGAQGVRELGDQTEKTGEKTFSASDIFKSFFKGIGIDADSAVDAVKNAFTDYKNILDGSGSHTGAAAGAMAGALTGSLIPAIGAVVEKIGDLIGNVIEASLEAEEAQARMQVALGLTKEEAEDAKHSIDALNATGIFKDGQAEQAITLVMRLFDETGTEAENLAIRMQAVSTGTGADLNSIAYTASTLARVFEEAGMTSEQALDLISAGLQTGKFEAGDLLDSLKEYAPAYERMGYSAEEMVQSLVAGVEAGAMSADKVGDSVKEFYNKAAGGSDDFKEALAELGVSADGVIDHILRGGPRAQHEYERIASKVADLGETTKAARLSSVLFGTQWEDTSSKVVLAAAQADTQIQNVTSASTQAVETMTSTSSAKIEAFGQKSSATFTNAFSGIGKLLTGDYQEYLEAVDYAQDIWSEDFAAKALDTGAQAGRNLGSSLSTQTGVALESSAPAIGSGFGEKMDAVFGNVGVSAGENMGTGITENAAGSILNGFGAVTSAIDQMAGEVNEAVSGMNANASAEGTAIPQNIANGVASSSGQVIAALQNLNAQMSSEIHNGGDAASAERRVAAQKEYEAVKTEYENVKDAYRQGEAGITKDMVDQTEKRWRIEQQNFYKFGKDIPDAMKQGLEKNKNSFLDAMSGLIANAKKSWSGFIESFRKNGAASTMAGGYASGTSFASRGLHPVAEHGAELIETRNGSILASTAGLFPFSGGERVYTAAQTSRMVQQLKAAVDARQARLSIGAHVGVGRYSPEPITSQQQITNNNQTYKYEFKVDDIATYQAIEAREKNRAQQMRQGVSQRYR